MSQSRRPLRRRAFWLGAAMLLIAPSVSSAAPTTVRASNRDLASQARGVGKGAKLHIKGFQLKGESASSTLELERFDVWRPDAVVEIDGQKAAAPTTAYFRGKVGGDDASVAVVSVRESGEVQGIVQKGGRSWLVGKGRNQRALKSVRADEEEMPSFECGNDDTFTAEERLGDMESDHLAELLGDGSSAALGGDSVAALGTVLDQGRVASIAIETDYEFYAKFGNTQAALDYMGDLIGYADLTYSREVNTDIQIGYSRLWTGGATTDPWTIGGCVDANGDGVADNPPCGTSGLLDQLRSHWNANMTSVNRTLVHMLSGKGLGGGIAYIGILCQNWSSSKGNTNDYGLSASLGGTFNWDGDQAHNPVNVVWDIVVVQHEIGHNFNSPHAHDYCNLGGSALPIDNCWSGCQAGATIGLPSCSAPTPHFTSGGGTGTIMSYCHQRSGGYGNIAMTFGENHTCGTLPGRQALRMDAHVTARRTTYPSCFASTATCGNGSLEAGEQCDGGLLGGATCTSRGFTGGTLSCTSSCTFNTSQCTNTPTCGNGVIDAGEQCDGGLLGGATCTSRGFAGGTLGCTSSCTWNTAQCTNCGNGVINAGEVCDGTALNGATCASQGCTSGVLGCNATCSGYTKVSCFGCPICDGDGTCETGENCTGCPGDCRGGTNPGATCGNGVCEAGNGEDCLSCAADCNGIQGGGNPSNRYCCGDGAGSNPLPCSNSKCTASGRTCTTVPKTATSYCCGNATCEAGESCSTCGLDCSGAVEICGNGLDDNCNGRIDCTDTTCSSQMTCQCRSSGVSCTAGNQCCSGSCKTTGKNPFTCN